MKWRIPLCRPMIGANELVAVRAVLESGNLANGPLADRFAGKIAKLHGLASGVAVSSGTLGLELSLRALGVGHGDFVACPAYTFVASANAILAVGAKPLFFDVDHCGIMLSKLPTVMSKSVKVAVVVDLFGASARAAGLAFQARGIPVVEDACESLGNLDVGYGDLVVFGFFPNKQITTGEGGVVCLGAIGHPNSLAYVEVVRNHGRGPAGFCRWGTNARMSEIHAALGLEQVKRLRSLLRARERVARWYKDALPFVEIGYLDEERSWFVFPVWFEDRARRDKVRDSLTRSGIQTGDYFPYLPDMPQFGKQPEFPTARRLSETGLALPFHPGLTQREVLDVARVIRLTLTLR